MNTSASMPTTVHNHSYCLSQTWRDLQWLVNSPSLLQHLAPSPYTLAQFTPLQTEALQQWLASKASLSMLSTDDWGKFSRLGLYAERLLSLALQQCPDIELLAQHFALHDNMPDGTKGKRTIGELDYIWRDNLSGAISHWELAVKLFLYIPPESNIQFEQQHPSLLDRFIGTQKKDTLFRKLQHLQQVQLPLAQHPLVNERLRLQIGTSAGFITGWLFYPMSGCSLMDWHSFCHYEVKVDEPFTQSLNPLHLRGWWLDADEFHAKVVHTQTTTPWRWKILPRLHWLSEHYCGLEETLSPTQLWTMLIQQWQYFREKGHSAQPLLVVALQPSEHGDDWQEVHRGFVVPRDWYGVR